MTLSHLLGSHRSSDVRCLRELLLPGRCLHGTTDTVFGFRSVKTHFLFYSSERWQQLPRGECKTFTGLKNQQGSMLPAKPAVGWEGGICFIYCTLPNFPFVPSK